MKLTAVVTNHNYARFLPRCLATASEFCDEVLVYDDGSTDDSLDVIPKELLAGRRDEASGSPVWGSNEGIKDASGDYIIFLDADNYLISRPATSSDYTYSDIELVDEAGMPFVTWEYPGWPLTASDALAHFERTATMPMPAGGAWRTGFLRENGCQWRHWATSKTAADFRTYIAWLSHDPVIAYRPEPCLCFRVHGAQSSKSPDKRRVMQEAKLLTRGYKI